MALNFPSTPAHGDTLTSGGRTWTWDSVASAWVGGAAAAQSANRVLAGPSSGSAAAPSYRALVPADLGARFAYHPDTPPASAHASDKEFAALTAHGGTVIGSPSTSPSIVDGALKIVGGTAGVTADAKGVEWACPSGAFTMRAKFRFPLDVANYAIGGLFLRAGASGAGNFCCMNRFLNSAAIRDWFFGYDRYSAPTTRTSAVTNVATAPLPAVYFYMRYDLTNIAVGWSISGHPDSYFQWRTETAATAIGGAPGRFGVYMDTFSGTASVLYCEWVRFT